MHLDEAAGAATLLGGLAASGWHSCCILMRIIADGFINESSSLGAPGVDEVRWLKPLRPGTQVRVRTTILETRASNSRPEIGFVKCLFELLDEQDTVLITLTSPLMIRRRKAGAHP
jgi:acyl dehydratase